MAERAGEELPPWRTEPRPRRALVEVLSYGPDGHEEETPATVEAVRDHLGRRKVTWVNVNRQDPALGRELERVLGLHPLAVEDAMKPGRRPKVEEHGDYVFVVAQMVDLAGVSVATEQLALFVGPKFLVTVQERPGDVFEPVRERIRQRHSFLVAGGPDRLAYMLLDALVDSYFPLLEDLGEHIERLEEEAMEEAGPETLQRIQDAKRQLLVLRRVAWPQRETLAILHHGDLSHVKRATRPFFRDVHDHTVTIMDVIETYRELAGNVMDLYLSSVNRRTNEVMKVLTVIATIFIPLTFVAGVYGMNFDTGLPGNMPELETPYAYPAVLAFMLAVAVSLLVFFRRKGWF